MTVVAEHTPNPDCLRFWAERELAPAPGADFPDAESAAAGSPLAARLFSCPGVRRVYLSGAYASVTRAAGVDWRTLGPRVIEVLEAYLASGEDVLAPGWTPPVSALPAEADPADIARLLALLDTEIRPGLALHGGDAELASYRDGVVRLRLRGACVDCPASIETLRLWVEQRLRAELPDIVSVVAE